MTESTQQVITKFRRYEIKKNHQDMLEFKTMRLKFFTPHLEQTEDLSGYSVTVSR